MSAAKFERDNFISNVCQKANGRANLKGPFKRAVPACLSINSNESWYESVLLNIRHVSKLERADKDKVPAIYTTTLICKKFVTTTTSVKEKHLIKMRDTRP